MKAMRLHAPKPAEEAPLRLDEVPVPKPAANEIVIRVKRCGVCRTDLHIVEGELPLQKTPVTPGHEIVGTVSVCGREARRFNIGDRVGIAWLRHTCGSCAFCTDAADRENLCPKATFTGWSADGGYAEYAAVPQAFAYSISPALSDDQAAPLLCAGIIGYRALKLSGVEPTTRLGLYGFGGSAHIAIQVARHWGCRVFVVTRSRANQSLARDLGAAWVGGPEDTPPEKLHGAIIFAPAGPIVRDALGHLEKGGTVALAGIYMSDIPALDYRKHLYDEKIVRSVANATRRDGEELLSLAAEIPIRTSTRVFPLEAANEALSALKRGAITGAAVLNCADLAHKPV